MEEIKEEIKAEPVVRDVKKEMRMFFNINREKDVYSKEEIL